MASLASLELPTDFLFDLTVEIQKLLLTKESTCSTTQPRTRRKRKTFANKDKSEEEHRAGSRARVTEQVEVLHEVDMSTHVGVWTYHMV